MVKKIVFAFGTRPEAIKMAPVINVFKKYKKRFEVYVVVTAQHREMLDQVLSLFNIKPDFDLNLMSPGQTLEELTSKILIEISHLIDQLKPNLIFVQGDTTTTFVTSLAAFYKRIPIAHIEAGLRTNNIYSPFPEEFNRKVTTMTSLFHFPPTDTSKKNLINENIDKRDILVCGNTVIDALLTISKKLDKDSSKEKKYFFSNFNIDFNRKKTLLVTGHRRESFGDGFENICKAIRFIAKNHDVQIIYPVHLNPNVQKPVDKVLSNISNIYLIPPLEYVQFVFLMKESYLILTDSGGVQEEAPSLAKPVLVMRDTTERPEGVEKGTAMLIGTEYDSIVKSVSLILNDKKMYKQMAIAANPYGDGNSSKMIYNFILENEERI